MMRLLASLAVLCALPAWAVTCENMRYDGNRYTVCTVNPATEELRLFLNDSDGSPYGQFGAVDRALSREGKTLSFAMNAGMYHDDRAPVGYYVENGKEIMRVISTPGPGNFGLLPNGILCLRPGRADVFETLDFVARGTDCTFATQSGPMLVIDGELHPRFLVDSTSRFVRNGVGITADGSRAVFAISNNAVTFHDFGALFRDKLGTPNALFFDGNISRLYAPDVNRDDFGFALGPIIGTVEPIAR